MGAGDAGVVDRVHGHLVPRLGALGKPDQGDDALDLGGQGHERLADGVEEVVAEQQVLGRIAREAELGQHDQVGSAVAGALDLPRDQALVALDVAHRGIDLRQGEAYWGRFGHA